MSSSSARQFVLMPMPRPQPVQVQLLPREDAVIVSQIQEALSRKRPSRLVEGLRRKLDAELIKLYREEEENWKAGPRARRDFSAGTFLNVNGID